MIYYSLKFYPTLSKIILKTSSIFLAQFGVRKITVKSGGKIDVESKYQRQVFCNQIIICNILLTEATFRRCFGELENSFSKVVQRKFPTKYIWSSPFKKSCRFSACHILLTLPCSWPLFENQDSTQSTLHALILRIFQNFIGSYISEHVWLAVAVLMQKFVCSLFFFFSFSVSL